MAEQFIIIRGYPDYSISNLQRVKSTKGSTDTKPKERILRQALAGGYRSVGLIHDGIKKTFYIHRLMAMHFLPRIANEGQLVVDHINRDKMDNRPENLRWITQSDNNRNKDVYGTIYRDVRCVNTYYIQYTLESGTKLRTYFSGANAQHDAEEHLWMLHMFYNRAI